MFIGGIVPCYLYNFIFKNLNFENILAETLEHNNMVAEMNCMGLKKQSINSKIKGKDKITIRNNYKLSKFDWQKNNQFNIYEDIFFLPKNKLRYFRNEKKI